MTYTGTVRDGRVLLPPDANLPDGTQVRVEALEDSSQPTLAERLKPIIGIANGLPSDLAANHDHYLHGRPKK